MGDKERPRGHHGHAPRHLFWRIYRHGLLLLFAVFISALAVSALLRQSAPWHDRDDPIATYMSEAYQRHGSNPQDLKVELDRLAALHPWVEAAYYDPRGQPLLASSKALPSALDGETLEALKGRSRRALRWPQGGLRPTILFPIESAEGPLAYGAITSNARGDRWLLKVAATLGTVLLVLALVSVPLARNIAAPVEGLTRAVRAFGEGDLATRIDTCRSDEVGELSRAFNHMAERIQGLITSQQELLANISHELRTPLARIRVALELAEEDPEASREWIGEIAQDLAELERLVDDVLTTARLELAEGRVGDGHPPLRAEALDPGALLEEAAARFRAAHPDRELRQTRGASLPPIQGDKVLLRRVIDNLLDNAAKYGPPDRPIELQAQAEGPGIRVSVTDQGTSLSEADLPRLFDPFYRVDPSRDRRTGGIGLGLTLARRIVESHGGAIEARLVPGGGTRLTFTLPPRPEASA